MAPPDLTFISYVPPALIGTSEESGSTPVYVFTVAPQKDVVDGSTGIDAPTLAGIAISVEFCSVLVALQRSQMFEDVFQHDIWTGMISQMLHEQRWVWGNSMQIVLSKIQEFCPPFPQIRDINN
ncbi:hypothetical protein B0H17DRAFT_1133933 [Mycena rosella]|uniref:Uncharacterized protein n=1 Tax=Mycena rosella TaxID=1033263 RepID=A0AAD7DGM9_MYCRO|nr:hypothetical protein B0H17DRAFT_1133933 [Mycena rosella]